MERIRKHLSFSNGVALLALFIALGGVTYAAANLPKNSVGAKQLKKNAVRSSKVKTQSLLKKDFKAGQLPRGAKGDKGDSGTPGAPGTPGANGTAVAFARIDSAGNLIGGADQSKGVTAANIQHQGAGTPDATVNSPTGAGVYCFGGLGFTPKSAVVSLDNTDAMPAIPSLTGGSVNLIPSVAVFKGEDLGRCDAQHGQVRVAIEQVDQTNAPTLANHGFFIWFE